MHHDIYTQQSLDSQKYLEADIMKLFKRRWESAWKSSNCENQMCYMFVYKLWTTESNISSQTIVHAHFSIHLTH